MSDELVKRLRDRGVCSLGHNSCRKNDIACEQAADRIEELEAENADLKAKLAKAVECIKYWEISGCPHCYGDCSSANPPVSHCIVQKTYRTLAELTSSVAANDKVNGGEVE